MSKTVKTTKEDFTVFQECCVAWTEKLGVKNWSIHYEHGDADESYARTLWKLSDRIATVIFGKEWDALRPKTPDQIDRLALHEVLHLVMAPLVAEADDRFSTQSAIDIAEHAIIRQLENLF